MNDGKPTGDRALGRRIASLLDQKNLTHQELADAVGVTRSHITHIISGRAYPGKEVVPALAEALGESETFIMRGTPRGDSGPVESAMLELLERFGKERLERLIYLTEDERDLVYEAEIRAHDATRDAILAARRGRRTAPTPPPKKKQPRKNT